MRGSRKQGRYVWDGETSADCKNIWIMITKTIDCYLLAPSLHNHSILQLGFLDRLRVVVQRLVGESRHDHVRPGARLRGRDESTDVADGVREVHTGDQSAREKTRW